MNMPSEQNNSVAGERSLKYISYGIYLQIFLGLGWFALAWLPVEKLPKFVVHPATIGGMLVFLAINSLVYMNRYKKSTNR